METLDKVTFAEFCSSFRHYATVKEAEADRDYHGMDAHNLLLNEAGVYDRPIEDFGIFINKWGDYYFDDKTKAEDDQYKYSVVVGRSESYGHDDCKEVLARWSHDEGRVEISDCPEVTIW